MYFPVKDPTFARLKYGHTIPILHDFDFNICLELVHDIENEVMRPQYVILANFQCAHNMYCYDTCMEMFNGLGLYELEKAYLSDLAVNLKEKTLFRRPRFLYKLKEGYQPF